MNEYETIYVTSPDLAETESHAVQDKIKAVLADRGAHLLRCKDWGVRRTAYDVGKSRRNRFYHLYFLGKGGLVQELERNLRLDERVLRFHTVSLGAVVDVKARINQAKAEEKKAAEAAAAREAERSKSDTDDSTSNEVDDNDTVSSDATPEVSQ